MEIPGERKMGEREIKAMSLRQYTVLGFWGPRREAPEALTVRLDRLIDRLASIDPVFGNWIWVGNRPRPIRLKTIHPHLTQEIADAVWRADDGEPVPARGYVFGLVNSMKTNPRSISMRIFAGNALQAIGYFNHAVIETGWRVEPDPAIITYPIFRSALLALAELFDVTFCNACPADLNEYWAKGCKFRFA